MLVNSKEILINAKNEKKCVPQFNINNLEWTKYILEIVKNLDKPVILGVSEGAMKHMGGFKTVFNMVGALIVDLDIKSEVVLHLDHGTSFESCKDAIDAGFTSVMIDASKLPFEENVDITKRVVNYALEKNVSVEAELGTIPGEEDGIVAEKAYTNLDEAVKFVELTGIDSLAPSIGSQHGLYKGEVNINYELLNELNESLKIPIVLHGGSGISDEDLLKMVELGISKVNINTELQVGWAKSVRKFLAENPDVYDPRKINNASKDSFKEIIENKYKTLYK